MFSLLQRPILICIAPRVAGTFPPGNGVNLNAGTSQTKSVQYTYNGIRYIDNSNIATFVI